MNVRLAVVLMAPLALCGQWAQAGPTYEFEADVEGWKGMIFSRDGSEEQPLGGATVTHQQADVKSGQGALQFAYTAEKEPMKALVLDHPDLAGAQSLRFWAKASRQVPLLLGLKEAHGGNYGLLVLLPPKEWQRVAVNLADLAPIGQPPDDNAQLDLDEVETMGLLDITPDIAAEAGRDESSAQLLSFQLGPATLWIDRFEISAEPVAPLYPRRRTDEGDQIAIDPFGSGMMTWLPLGGAAAAFVANDGGSCIKLDYQPHPVAGIMRPFMAPVAPAETQGIRLRVKSHALPTLYIQVQEEDNSRYGIEATLTARDQWETLQFGLLELPLAAGSEDENGQLDPDQIKSVLVLDVSGADDPAVRTLWLDDIAFLVQP
jgi:hypothetical protein